ncbi:MAG TPA: rRNA maturation RNase YbeY, partial [Patescibacteria group bacterium]|nr:rRNA maturation RNase YbeY [Patescibacteria group bacterium]
ILLPMLKKKGVYTIGVRFVSKEEISKLNQQYRRKKNPTDVLSFGQPVHGSMPSTEWSLGDIVICPAFAKQEAKRRGLPWQEELVRLLIHGTLHLFGFDHQTKKDELRMYRLQEQCVERVMHV